MRLRTLLATLALIATTHVATSAQASAAPNSRSASCRDRIENFGQVTNNLFRAAQFPPECAGHLASLGIRTLIDLRRESSLTAIERERALAAGLQYIHSPMSPFARPSRDQVDMVLGIIRDPRNQPVLIHCKRGSDRTGVVAAYRITDEQWSSESAIEEARRFGLGWWQVHMKRFIKSLTPGSFTHLSPVFSPRRHAIQPPSDNALQPLAEGSPRSLVYPRPMGDLLTRPCAGSAWPTSSARLLLIESPRREVAVHSQEAKALARSRDRCRGCRPGSGYARSGAADTQSSWRLLLRCAG